MTLVFNWELLPFVLVMFGSMVLIGVLIRRVVKRYNRTPFQHLKEFAKAFIEAMVPFGLFRWSGEEEDRD